MNTLSQIVSILILWLITGLAFSSVFLKERKQGHSALAAFKTVEGVVFLLSIAVALIYLVFKL